MGSPAPSESIIAEKRHISGLKTRTSKRLSLPPAAKWHKICHLPL